MNNHRIYTVESVTEGHPDKVCDQISDAILDACLVQDPKSRVAVETFGSHGMLMLGGEVTTTAQVPYAAIARQVYAEIGYQNRLQTLTHIAQQSPDIAMGVDTGGAGDQGIMYGYATDETQELLPKGVVLAHVLTKRLADVRKSGEISWLGPDGKAQVTIEDGRVKSALVSTQHASNISQEEVVKTITEKVIRPVVGDDPNIRMLVNPTGAFVAGGFEADAGLTGRKIMVDTYGGLIPHGGGAFSGKDPTKVDRSAAYMCRFVARQLVKEGAAKSCLVSVAYAIGVAEPLMVSAVNEKGESLANGALSRFDFRPLAIMERLNLRTPIYRQTAAYGHFGKSNLPWEQ